MKADPSNLTGLATALFRRVRPSAVGEPLPTDTVEVRQLLGSAGFRADVAKLADELGEPVEAAIAEAAGYLREMSALHDKRVTDVWQRFGGWLTRGYDIVTDDDGLSELRKLDRKHALIFLISHRSYLDEFILPPLVQAGDLSPLFGMAGDNLNFFPLGPVARRTGIIHVRRSTGSVPIYRLALRSFVGQLVDNRANLCWSIEGGRSRTGKLRPPRFGLLRYVADAVDASEDADPLLVPVSFMYDQLPVHEVGLIASEARGEVKEAEDLRWLVNYASGLKERLGRVYLDFGEPLPLRQRLAELRAEEVAENQVERIAVDLCHRINAATPVTPTATVCIALLGADRALTLDQVLATVRPLAEYIQSRGRPVAGGATLTDRSTLRWALRELTRSGVLTSYTGGLEPVWGIEKEQHLIAAMYRNSAIHVLLTRAIAELALVSVASDGGSSEDLLLDVALRLRELLKFDFFFARRDDFVDELTEEVSRLAEPARPDGLAVTPEQAREWLANASPLVAHLVLRPYLDAYRVVAEELVGLDDEEVPDQAALVESCLRTGRQWALQRILASEESVSGEMYRTALKLAGHRDLLAPNAPELVTRRREFAAEVAELGRAVGRIADLDRAPAPALN